ncbi:unnamed protein product, partial [marine sediment metagenome]
MALEIAAATAAYGSLVVIVGVIIYRIGQYSKKSDQTTERLTKHVDVNHRDYSVALTSLNDKLDDVGTAVEGIRGYLQLGDYRTHPRNGNK